MDDQLEKELEKNFGYSAFRLGQKEIISDILKGYDVLGILPTGSGKSICYQLPAKILPGVVIVVSPLISLMIDQVKQLKATGFKEVVALNSFVDVNTRKSVMRELSTYKLIYLSPEMLQNRIIIEKLKSLHVSLFVIDEAHCISQWGHEFRPDYLKLDRIIEKLDNPTVLALSATATPEVQDDILEQLNCPGMIKHVYPMDRDNIAFSIERFDHIEEKLDYLETLLKEYPVPTMIYFSSRDWTQRASMELARRLPKLRVAFYHGGMEQTDRILIQQQFMKDQLDVICCTSAFGMGINKANIRLVIHFHLPTQVESFIQEVGRAGRDGQSSVSLVLVAPHDNLVPMRLIDSELPDQQMVKELFTYLLKLPPEHRLEEKKIVESFHLTETQWRFLQFQLEKHGMIVDNKSNFASEHFDSMFERIVEVIDSRNIYKQNKLYELLRWANETTCRRKALFSSFQDTVQRPAFFCCDVCDFSFLDWNPVINSHQKSVGSWQEKLQKLMLQGD